MPDVSTPNLKLIESEGRVTMEVHYTVKFNKLDRQLAGLGRTYHSHSGVYDYDGGDDVGALLVDFLPRKSFAVTVGTTDQSFPVVETFNVDRDVLRADTDGKDELKARVRIHADPKIIEEFGEQVTSDQEDLTS